MNTEIIYKTASTDQEFEEAKELFNEYAASLNVDLCFQNFSQELENVRKLYDKPTGALLVVYKSGVPVGCVGVRRFDDATAELKRMYVRPECRGLNIGKELLDRALTAAKELGYSKMRLDTLSSMTRAQKLYESFGFAPIPAYYFNPLEDTIYMEAAI
ncbi:GNAT family N-acetyltransferase [Dyadobacter sp. MSC1_007]|jgi:putative acetyltransferase|uniref:GNAT family N-acetyltransferase n=1 Tax=Dyadobacter sp. MSC1_007 TaxID=2909264 RepID=UPI00202F4B5C|nr:GNAT family N-acetyltransferase [Dyadobacter sp. MSC1_007]